MRGDRARHGSIANGRPTISRPTRRAGTGPGSTSTTARALMAFRIRAQGRRHGLGRRLAAPAGRRDRRASRPATCASARSRRWRIAAHRRGLSGGAGAQRPPAGGRRALAARRRCSPTQELDARRSGLPVYWEGAVRTAGRARLSRTHRLRPRAEDVIDDMTGQSSARSARRCLRPAGRRRRSRLLRAAAPRHAYRRGGGRGAVPPAIASCFPPAARVLDLMSSWVSHLPADRRYARGGRSRHERGASSPPIRGSTAGSSRTSTATRAAARRRQRSTPRCAASACSICSGRSRCSPRSRRVLRAGRAVRRQLLQPLLPDQGGRDLARARRRRPCRADRTLPGPRRVPDQHEPRCWRTAGAAIR